MQANTIVENMQELVWRKGDERCERSYREHMPTEKKALAEQENKKEEKWAL